MAEAPRKSLGDSPVVALKPNDSGAAIETATAVALPDPTEKVAAALRAIVPAHAPRAEQRTNPLLDQLVYGDNDLVGLVAYAMHEVNRRDWRNAYETTHGRPPSEAEFNAYLVGEQLDRRIETYRRLAEDAIAKVATGEHTMRRLSETCSEPARPQAIEKETAARPALSRSLQATHADKAVVPPPKNNDLARIALYLTFLLIAAAGLGYLLRFGI